MIIIDIVHRYFNSYLSQWRLFGIYVMFDNSLYTRSDKKPQILKMVLLILWPRSLSNLEIMLSSGDGGQHQDPPGRHVCF